MLHHGDVNYPRLAPQKGSTEKQSHDLDTVRSGQKLQIWSTCTPWNSWLYFQGLVSTIGR